MFVSKLCVLKPNKTEGNQAQVDTALFPPLLSASYVLKLMKWRVLRVLTGLFYISSRLPLDHAQDLMPSLYLEQGEMAVFYTWEV